MIVILLFWGGLLWPPKALRQGGETSVAGDPGGGQGFNPTVTG